MRPTFLLTFLVIFSPLLSNTVLITGANRGLGLEFARQYQAQGYEVVATARKPKRATELNRLGVQVEQVDVTDLDSIQSMVKRLDGKPIDLLINNAGIMRGRSAQLTEVTQDFMQDSFAVNATGPLLITQQLMPNLRAGTLKRIVHITSQLGSIQNNSGGMYAYRASKAALNQINKSMSIELEPEGFTCVVMHPGWVQTDMGGEQATYTPRQSVRSMIKVIAGLNSASNGRFLDLTGKELPW